MDILGFGSYLIIDGFGATPALLGSEEQVRRVTDGLSAKLEPLRTGERLSCFEDGLSRVIVMGESHLTLHTFVSAHSLSLSLFSRKTLHLQEILTELGEGFDIGRYESSLSNRSKTYSHDLEGIEALLMGERSYVSARLDEHLVV